MRQWTGLKSGTICDLQGRSSSLSSSSWTNGRRWFHSRLLRSLEDALCRLWHPSFQCCDGQDHDQTGLGVCWIPQVPYVAVVEGDDVDEKIATIEATLSYPVFTKPSNMGSSVGISKSENQTELRTALELAFKYDSRVLVEQGVNAREIEVGLLGNYDVKSTLPGEVVKDVAFYDYDAKYIDNKITMAIPAQLDPEVVKTMRTNAEKAFRAIGGLGLARCDFFYTDKGEIFLNELNTMPGFTQWSMYPLLWDNMGLNYTDLITKLVELEKKSSKNTKRICCKKERVGQKSVIR